MIAAAIAVLPLTTFAEEPRDPLEYGPFIATVEGAWSLMLTAGFAVSARSLDAPFPDGIAGLVTARVLYGTSWSALLAGEIALARWLSGPRWEGLSVATYRSEWLIGHAAPGPCTRSCAGLGGANELRARLGGDGIPVEVAASSGWIQGRAIHDERRTVLEATWVQSPIGVRVRPSLELQPFVLELSAGPGVYWGLHNAHVHPQSRELDVPWHQLAVLDAGLGFGGKVEAALRIADWVTLGAELELAWMALANAPDDPPAIAAPLGARADGELTWRRASAGIALHPPAWAPVSIGLRYAGLELSRRELDALGHRAVVVRFDFPIWLDE